MLTCVQSPPARAGNALGATPADLQATLAALRPLADLEESAIFTLLLRDCATRIVVASRQMTKGLATHVARTAARVHILSSAEAEVRRQDASSDLRKLVLSVVMDAEAAADAAMTAAQDAANEAEDVDSDDDDGAGGDADGDEGDDDAASLADDAADAPLPAATWASLRPEAGWAAAAGGSGEVMQAALAKAANGMAAATREVQEKLAGCIAKGADIIQSAATLYGMQQDLLGAYHELYPAAEKTEAAAAEGAAAEAELAADAGPTHRRISFARLARQQGHRERKRAAQRRRRQQQRRLLSRCEPEGQCALATCCARSLFLSLSLSAGGVQQRHIIH
jgi:hypothetical protein